MKEMIKTPRMDSKEWWDGLRLNAAEAYNDLARKLLDGYDEDEDLVVVHPDVISDAMSQIRFLIFMLGEMEIPGVCDKVQDMRLRAFGDGETLEWTAPMSYKVNGQWLESLSDEEE
jgi:hypothetical protein